MPVALATVVAHADRLLQPQRFSDYPGAVNGLQMENRGRVTRIAAAVDQSQVTVQDHVVLMSNFFDYLRAIAPVKK